MKKYFRFLFGLRKFLKNRLAYDQALKLARQILRVRVAQREENFPSLVEKGIFGYAKNPYLKLLTPPQ